MKILPDPATSGTPAKAGSVVPADAPPLRSWAAVKAGTRVRMSLGAKSRRRRRPQADGGGHLPPRAFAPAPTSLQTQRFSLGPHVPGALRLPGLRGPGTKKPPQGGGFVTTGCAASAMQFAGGLRLVLDRQHAQVDVAVAGH